MFSRTNPRTTLFPVYLLPSIPFRRRQASDTSTDSSTSSHYTDNTTLSSSPSSSSSTSSSASPDDTDVPPVPYLPGHTSHLRCSKCATDICLTSQVISKGFTGRHGRAYLVSPCPLYSSPSQTLAGATKPHPALPNTKTDAPSQRQLVTGAHTVSDVRCAFCNSMLGWKYDGAEEETQRYKVGKYILETKMVCSVSDWEFEGEVEGERLPGTTSTTTTTATAGDMGMKDRGKDAVGKTYTGKTAGTGAKRVSGPVPAAQVEFDSQDEDECEDLFAGVWSPGLAMKRRQNKSFRKAMVAELEGKQTSY